VVDFLDAASPVAWGLERSHVYLGEERLRLLRKLFPDHDLSVVQAGLWRYFSFRGRVDEAPRESLPPAADRGQDGVRASLTS
jgi:hypothetical protein